MNQGLSASLKNAFPELSLEAIQELKYTFQGIPDPMWVAGFVSGDGSFFLKYTKHENTYYTGLIFAITLHLKDKDLLLGLFSYLDSYFQGVTYNKYVNRGNVGIYYRENTVTIKISNMSDIRNIVIPFFELHPILGVKSIDFADFKRVYQIILSKNHLTPEGLTEIENIRNNMNARRKLS